MRPRRKKASSSTVEKQAAAGNHIHMHIYKYPLMLTNRLPCILAIHAYVVMAREGCEDLFSPDRRGELSSDEEPVQLVD